MLHDDLPVWLFAGIMRGATPLSNEPATFAFVVDTKDAVARRFYERFSMRSLDATGRRLFIPMAEIAKLFAGR